MAAKGTSRTPGPTLIQRSRAIGAAQKATYHQIEGAGRSHVLRRFFDLDESDVDAIVTRVSVSLDDRLGKAS